MAIALVTGSAGLIGSETVAFLIDKGMAVHGIDNDMRSVFFGEEASTRWNQEKLESTFENYTHHSLDIRSQEKMEALFQELNTEIDLIVHCAAQPSHDWAAKDEALKNIREAIELYLEPVDDDATFAPNAEQLEVAV